MSGNLQGFNAEEVEPQGDFEPIPAGYYTAMITESEFRPTKAGDGEYLNLRFDIIDGEYEGRVLFARLNLSNPNPKAVDIAQRQLSSICRAVGIMAPDDSSDLHDKPLKIKVSVRPAENGYEATNEVKDFAPAESMKPPAQKSAAKQAPKKPWDK